MGGGGFGWTLGHFPAVLRIRIRIRMILVSWIRIRNSHSKFGFQMRMRIRTYVKISAAISITTKIINIMWKKIKIFKHFVGLLYRDSPARIYPFLTYRFLPRKNISHPFYDFLDGFSRGIWIGLGLNKTASGFKNFQNF